MVDTWNVTAAYTQPSYGPGEVPHVRISGDFVRDETQTETVGPLSFNVVAESGETLPVTLGTVYVSWLTQVHKNVVIDPAVAIIDGSGGTWTIDADGLGITRS